MNLDNKARSSGLNVRGGLVGLVGLVGGGLFGLFGLAVAEEGLVVAEEGPVVDAVVDVVVKLEEDWESLSRSFLELRSLGWVCWLWGRFRSCPISILVDFLLDLASTNTGSDMNKKTSSTSSDDT